MPVARVTLAIAVLGGAALLASSATAWGQDPPGRAEVWGAAGLTPDQIRKGLGKLGGTDALPPELLDALNNSKLFDELLKQVPKGKAGGIDPKQVEDLRRLLDANPKFKQRVEDIVRHQKEAGKPLDRAELEKQFKQLPPPTVLPPPAVEPKPGERPPLDPVPPKGVDEVPPPAPNAGPKPEADPLRPDLLNTPETPEQKQRRAIGELWEKNVGPLRETPTLQQLLFDIADATDDFKGADGKSLWESLGQDGGDGSSFADFINGAAGEGWSFPKFEWPSFGWSKGNPDRVGGGPGPSPSGGSWWNRGRSSGGSRGGSGGGFGFSGGDGSLLPVVVLAVVLFGALLLWRFWYFRDPKVAQPPAPGGLGAWPVDPRRIATRHHVVLAFEYLSVLICGPAAKTWTHTTIAGALADLAATHGPTAVMLARLYELARYAPLDEPLTTAELAEARRLVCGLAGLGDE